MDTQQVFTKVEAATYLRLSLRTIDTLTSRRELMPARVGRRVLFTRSELDAFLAHRRAATEATARAAASGDASRNPGRSA